MRPTVVSFISRIQYKTPHIHLLNALHLQSPTISTAKTTNTCLLELSVQIDTISEIQAGVIKKFHIKLYHHTEGFADRVLSNEATRHGRDLQMERSNSERDDGVGDEHGGASLHEHLLFVILRKRHAAHVLRLRQDHQHLHAYTYTGSIHKPQR